MENNKTIMKYFFLLTLFYLFSLNCFGQELPLELKNNLGSIEYEKILTFDSTLSKDEIFNAVKRALIKNSNYKYDKIDEDRNSGNISTKIQYSFVAKPGIVKIEWNCYSILSIDVRSTKIRLRVSNILYSNIILNTPNSAPMDQIYDYELDLLNKGKWKAIKSMIIPWDKKIVDIINGFGTLVLLETKDSF